jgi:hypothetical protein
MAPCARVTSPAVGAALTVPSAATCGGAVVGVAAASCADSLALSLALASLDCVAGFARATVRFFSGVAVGAGVASLTCSVLA